MLSQNKKGGTCMDEKKNINEMLEEQQRDKAAAFARSAAGQKMVVEEYRDWGRKEYEDCCSSFSTVERWTNNRGEAQVRVSPGLTSGADVPEDGFVESNHESRMERLRSLTEFIAVVEAMRLQLSQQRTALPEEYRATLEKLKADLPDRNAMQIIRAPKSVKAK
jgi:hypothetical protein